MGGLVRPGLTEAERLASSPIDNAARNARYTILQPRSTDDVASALLDELDRLQTLMTLNMSRGREWVAAGDLVQRTRIFIIERCKRDTRP